jgi:hypothetical protein
MQWLVETGTVDRMTAALSAKLDSLDDARGNDGLTNEQRAELADSYYAGAGSKTLSRAEKDAYSAWRIHR